MKMSLAYMEETTLFYRDRGFQVERKDEELGKTMDHEVVKSSTFTLSRENQTWELQCVDHPDTGERYFLKLHYYQLVTHSLEVDSWKFKKDQIEFRYLTHDDTGQNVTFTVELGSKISG